MKKATMEEIEGIRLIAEQNLSVYKERASDEDYKTILVLTMHEIAKDMRLEIGDEPDVMVGSFPGKIQLFEIQDAQDLEYLKREWGSLPPPHLLITSDFESLHDELRKLCIENKVFSFFVMKITDSVSNFAKSIDHIPIFVVDDKKAALAIVRELHANPVRAVAKAVNGNSVVLKYLEGRPT
jgi:hypothetical protein